MDNKELGKRIEDLPICPHCGEEITLIQISKYRLFYYDESWHLNHKPIYLQPIIKCGKCNHNLSERDLDELYVPEEYYPRDI